MSCNTGYHENHHHKRAKKNRSPRISSCAHCLELNKQDKFFAKTALSVTCAQFSAAFVHLVSARLMFMQIYAWCLLQTAHLFSSGSVAPTTALLRLGGPPGSGKSTLTESLGTSKVGRLFRYESQRDEGAANAQARTKGLCHVAWTDDKGAPFIITDMGGHNEFFLAHQAFVAYDDVPAINAIVVSSLKKDEIIEDVRRWAGFFACRVVRSSAKPGLILIATRLDQASPENVTKVGQAHRMLQSEFGEVFMVHEKPFVIDSRKSWSTATQELRKALHRIRSTMIKVSVRAECSGSSCTINLFTSSNWKSSVECILYKQSSTFVALALYT